MPIKFKSIPLMYSKERVGTKNNTVRILDASDGRHLKLLMAMNNEAANFDGLIEIENSITKESFVREITDITEWSGFDKPLLIITWKHDALKESNK